MNPLTRKLVCAGIAVVAVGGLGTAAFAQAPVTTRPAPSTTTFKAPAVDTDQVRQGDQSTPDKTDKTDKADAPDTSDKTDPAGSGGTDSPGDHQDQPGTVDANSDGGN